MRIMICKGAIQYLELFLILFFSCFCFKFSIAIDTITLTQPINDPETIISSNKAFQLGFFSPVNTTNRFVGIWYKNIPVRTVVWVANRDMPLIDSSGTLMISKDGNLVVLNGKKEIIWSSNVPNSMANSSACLLDSGNLVLVDNSNGRTIWESFRYPSDSFLVKMVLSSDVSTDKKRDMKLVLAISVIVGSIIISICAYFLWMGMVKQRGLKKKSDEMLPFKKLTPEYSTVMTFEDNLNQVKLEKLPLFKFEKLAIATDEFHETNKLGQGGFG
ncbi:G-type lectin S-receptor-like serine/threonine-protein kinase [Camellia lanceoleosa]|uniref:G-type lectin S-receptor-like serine/threonine-protein kinase n=1 Tax=Camellia lanceoleosa TaxID=1840588 RepID=A0ACC0GHT8_9ERIC|nr:G-type lectin S-receptor-like serine/threonine-protein kinase [Camellia lanceoleosa]